MSKETVAEKSLGQKCGSSIFVRDKKNMAEERNLEKCLPKNVGLKLKLCTKYYCSKFKV